MLSSKAIGLRDTPICALSTPPGTSGIAVIRITGNGCIPLFQPLFSKLLEIASSHTAHFGIIKQGDDWIDEVVVTLFKGPNSFTGEDTLEISCHGSPYIQQRIIQALTDQGIEIAEAGEFTMRAFRNGKLDLSQAEAVADLISSNSKTSHDLAMQQLRGGFSKEIAELREQLIHFASMIELELDFSEEDVEFANRDQLRELIDNLRSRIKELIDSFQTGNVIKEGVPVAIVGRPNAGKSTLLNALLKEDRAIVSATPGTTRDTVEDVVNIEGIRFRFIDTAGLRDTVDEVEALGIERSMAKIAQAQIVIYVYDAQDIENEDLTLAIEKIRNAMHEGARLKVVQNKSDLSEPHENHLSISAKDGLGIEALKKELAGPILQTLSSQNTVVTNARHHAALTSALNSLEEVRAGLDSGITGDFLAIDIRKSLHHLGEITGEISNEDLLDNIFSRFCIGK